jgi:hypothetical protein
MIIRRGTSQKPERKPSNKFLGEHKVRETCGSGLARDGGGSITINVKVMDSSRASPLPQVREKQ